MGQGQAHRTPLVAGVTGDAAGGGAPRGVPDRGRPCRRGGGARQAVPHPVERGAQAGRAPREIAGALAWGFTRVATLPDDRVLRELGAHVHDIRVGEQPPPQIAPVGIAGVHAAFAKWFGQGYDLEVLSTVLAVAAAGLVLDGDPANVLVVGGSGAAKTETVSSLAAADAVVTSTIICEGALLSGTSSKERSKDATGGLLRKVGDRGVVVIKDATSILSMNRDARAAVLAALGEVADGFWERNLGVDGGRSIGWRGRCTLIGAVTTAWDQAHGVVTAMGDRFLLVRMPDEDALAAGAQALANTGEEVTMRAELATAVGGLLQHLTPAPAEPKQYGFILPLADLVTWTRTAVVTGYRGDVVDAHAREHPTRFSKQLAQIHRGARCIGLSGTDATRLVVRVARDSLPPMRRIVLAGLLDQEVASTTMEVARRVGRPRSSIDKQLQALLALRLAEIDDQTPAGEGGTPWRWRLSERVDRDTLALLVSRNVGTPPHQTQSAPTASPEAPPEPTTLSTSYPNTPSTNIPGHAGRGAPGGDACPIYLPDGNPDTDPATCSQEQVAHQAGAQQQLQVLGGVRDALVDLGGQLGWRSTRSRPTRPDPSGARCPGTGRTPPGWNRPPTRHRSTSRCPGPAPRPANRSWRPGGATACCTRADRAGRGTDDPRFHGRTAATGPRWCAPAGPASPPA